MSSDRRPADFIQEPELVGRTWADVLYRMRWILLVVLGVVVCVVLVAVYRPDTSGLSAAIHDNEDAIKAFIGIFILFFLIGRSFTIRVLSVQTVDYLVLDFVNLKGAIYRIPVPLLPEFRISGGNNLSFCWRDGHIFKLARRVDLEEGVIETAWPHEVPIEQAAFTLSDLQAREKDYQDCKIENLYLRRRPVVIASDLARQANDHLADEISDAMELGRLDIGSYLDGIDPLSPRRAADDDQEEQPSEQQPQEASG